MRPLNVRGGIFTPTVTLLSLLLLGRPIAAHPRPAGDLTTTVQAGQSIQAAIDAAQPGAQITIEAGTYAEQLTINKDGISLIGKGAILVPPATPVQNTCTGLAGNGTAAGICITGSGIQLVDYIVEHRKLISVDQPVKDVSITGFQIRDFTGENIAVVGGENIHLVDNTVYNGAQYGFLSVGSFNTRITNNAVISEGTLRFIAICMDDKGDVQATNNRVSGYYIGLCIQTPRAELTHNTVDACCVGASIDPGVPDVRFLHNHIGPNHVDCAATSVINIGVFIYGSVNAVVQSNVIEGQHAGGMAAGIALVDAVEVPPPVIATGNTVSLNVLRDNDFDVFVNTTGIGNVAVSNQCVTPVELCG